MIEFTNTEIEGLLIIKPHMSLDARGFYKKCFEKEQFSEVGITSEFTETSDIYSTKGVLRGLHYQTKFSQAKLLHVILGTIFDVVLDLRLNSKTFGKFHTELLTADENKLVYIPENFAHGFITLSEKSIFSYQCSGKYDPNSCGGIVWNDNGLNIPWPLREYSIDNVICTDKDKSWPSFKEYCMKFDIKNKVNNIK